MSVSIRPDPDDQFIIINIDGELVSVANLQQDIEFTVASSNGRPLRSGKSTPSLLKALGELRVIDDLEALEALAEHIEIWLQAQQSAAFAARDRGEGLEIAELDSERDWSTEREDLEWMSPDQALVVVKSREP